MYAFAEICNTKTVYRVKTAWQFVNKLSLNNQLQIFGLKQSKKII